jgi:hypothetical protein
MPLFEESELELDFNNPTGHGNYALGEDESAFLRYMSSFSHE